MFSLSFDTERVPMIFINIHAAHFSYVVIHPLQDIDEPRGAEQAQGQSKDLNSLRCSVFLKWLSAIFPLYCGRLQKQVGRGKLDAKGFANPLPSSAPMLVAAITISTAPATHGASMAAAAKTMNIRLVIKVMIIPIVSKNSNNFNNTTIRKALASSFQELYQTQSHSLQKISALEDRMLSWTCFYIGFGV